MISLLLTRLALVDLTCQEELRRKEVLEVVEKVEEVELSSFDHI